MRAKIEPAYLGFSAGQSERSQSRGITKRIWMMQNGIRIPVAKMNDAHLVRVVLILDGFAKRLKKDLGVTKISILKGIPCFPELVKEGYRRGLLHSNGFPNKTGLNLIGLGKDKE